MSHLFSKIFKLKSNFGIRLMKLGLFLRQFKKILKICLYQFLLWVRGHRYTRRLILRPISAARPRIDLCTKNPPPHPRVSYKMPFLNLNLFLGGCMHTCLAYENCAFCDLKMLNFWPYFIIIVWFGGGLHGTLRKKILQLMSS